MSSRGPQGKPSFARRLDLAAAGLNPFLQAVAAGLLVFYLMLYIGVTAPRPSRAASVAETARLTPTASSYPAPPDYVR
ncbi:MAG TPA: hypothetical protein VFQ90_09985 [Stellaceae bacterium]|jgi:hypothetical protein|nr:hypothetical protein [Stellaceae bacterium]